ncbi:MAG: zinc ribbon domain-containing protein [Acidobacteriaceae bacterium]|nr:zinc ribbon domain-containing protein [Acidobacteriaceae bacterium]
MFCDGCGAQIEPGQSFCPRCGKALVNMPLMPVQSRIAGHLRLLGILWLALSAFRLLPGLILTTLFRPETRLLPPEVPPFVPFLVHSIGLFLVIIAAIGAAIGWGLLTRQSWARLTALIFGGLSLIDVPFGTALGVYTLWVLLPARSEEEYRQIAQAA